MVHEKGGMQPAAARIISLLLVSDKVELTFDEIRETLNLSKSATSNALNLLLTTSKIDYITKPGDRKRYFRSRVTHWVENFKHRITNLKGLAGLLNEVLIQRPENTIDFNNSLRDVIGFLNYLSDKIPSIYEEWEQMKK